MAQFEVAESIIRSVKEVPGYSDGHALLIDVVRSTISRLSKTTLKRPKVPGDFWLKVRALFYVDPQAAFLQLLDVKKRRGNEPMSFGELAIATQLNALLKRRTFLEMEHLTNRFDTTPGQRTSRGSLDAGGGTRVIRRSGGL